MSNRLILLLFGFVFFTFLVLAGCLPTQVSKPEVSSPSQPQAAGQESIRLEQESTSLSSLEAFRTGKEIPSVPRTSQSSPLKDVYFEFDRYNLRPDAREGLKANVEWLKANRSVRVEIEGHADERGTNEYNLALGARRTQAVKDYLTTLGVSLDRLSTISYGEELPVCREKTEECWQKNRRAHFVIITVRPSTAQKRVHRNEALLSQP